MPRSMTGFGRGEAELDNMRVVTEVSGLNHRFLDPSIRLPSEFSPLEANLRSILKTRLARGRVSVIVDLTSIDGTAARAATFDSDLAANYVEKLRDMASGLGLNDDLALSTVIGLPGVTETAKVVIDMEALQPALMESFERALDVFDEARSVEGATLSKDVVEHVESIRSMADAVETRCPLVVDAYRERLHARVKEIDESNLIEPDRLAAEIALYADKCDVSEEIVRLRSHVERFLDLLGGGEPVGRQLDFLCQEMHREITTIGSKGRDSDISHIVVEAKGELEKVREQVQNLE
jgi:uncharacterized protein (TIGR00255 family)